jgi:hypothetical protein
MLPNLRIKEHLTCIRDGMKKVCLITRSLGSEPEQADLETALSLREAVLATEVERRARELSAAFPDWSARVKSDEGLSGLLGESEALMRSIVLMDEEMSRTLQNRMRVIKTKMSSVYHTSRAAGSYTVQSKLRAKSPVAA